MRETGIERDLVKYLWRDRLYKTGKRLYVKMSLFAAQNSFKDRTKAMKSMNCLVQSSLIYNPKCETGIYDLNSHWGLFEPILLLLFSLMLGRDLISYFLEKETLHMVWKGSCCLFSKYKGPTKRNLISSRVNFIIVN